MRSYTFDQFMNSSLSRAYLFKRVVSMPRFELQTNELVLVENSDDTRIQNAIRPMAVPPLFVGNILRRNYNADRELYANYNARVRGWCEHNMHKSPVNGLFS